MGERKNSVGQMQEGFIKKGGVCLGTKEWDKVFDGVDDIIKKRWREHTMAVDDKQRYQEYNFLTEIYLSRSKLAFEHMSQARKQNKNGAVAAFGNRSRWNSDCMEICVRQDDGNYYTFYIEEGEGVVRESDRPEIIGYLCMKLLSGELTLEEVLSEVFVGEK